MKRGALFFIVGISLTLAGCGASGDQADEIADTVFNDAVVDVAPTFEAAGASPSSSPRFQVVTTWESGNPVYDVFYLLREFNPDTDSGVIDTSNLYKTMYEGRNFLANTRDNCAVITAQTITPPFDFGNPNTTYDCAYNEEADDGYDFGGAIREQETVMDGLFGFVWASDDHNEYGVLQGSFNSSNDDLSLDTAVWVDYTDEDDYCYRNDIDGNAASHLFTFRSIKGNRVEGSYFFSVVGRGVSQGEGEYFLLKIFTNDLPDGRYYCVGAEDDETVLEAMDAEGNEAVDDNCAEYQEAVDATAPFTTEDLACESPDFNPGGEAPASEGTIFLNFL